MRTAVLLLLAAACSFDPETVEDPAPVPGGDDEPIDETPADTGGGSAATNPDPTDPCVALTCADLAAECGSVDNGCGVQLDCGGCDGSCEDSRCVCPADRMEPNPSPDGAHDLGEVLDELGADETFGDLVMRDMDDEDWFTFHVYDAIGVVNPIVAVELEQDGEVHQLDVFYTCDGGDDDTTCTGLAQSTSGFGTACRGTGSDPGAGLTVQCGGTLDESGTVWVRVRRSTWDGSCQAYSLRVRVNR
jgi:hypothetical protein